MQMNKIFRPSVGADLSAFISINLRHKERQEAG